MDIRGDMLSTTSTDSANRCANHTEHPMSPEAQNREPFNPTPANSPHPSIPLSANAAASTSPARRRCQSIIANSTLMEASNNQPPENLPFGLIKVMVRGKISPKFGYKAVLLQYCQKASHLFMQIAAEIGGGFCHGLPHEDEYQICISSCDGPESAGCKQNIVSNDHDLRNLLQPFVKDKVVLDVRNIPLISIDFVHNRHLDLAAKRSPDHGTCTFHLMVEKIISSSKFLHVDHQVMSILLTAVHNGEQGRECVSSDYTAGCLENRRLENLAINDQVERPTKRRRLSNSATENDIKYTTNFRATEQAAQDEAIAGLLADKEKLSQAISTLANELEQTKLARNFLRMQRERSMQRLDAL